MQMADAEADAALQPEMQRLAAGLRARLWQLQAELSEQGVAEASSSAYCRGFCQVSRTCLGRARAGKACRTDWGGGGGERPLLGPLGSVGPPQEFGRQGLGGSGVEGGGDPLLGAGAGKAGLRARPQWEDEAGQRRRLHFLFFACSGSGKEWMLGWIAGISKGGGAPHPRHPFDG